MTFKTKNGRPIHILTTRFNNETFEQNAMWRERMQHNGCIYCSPSQMPKAIPTEAVILMIEMNNQINQITGIGIFINKKKHDKQIIYSDRNYNRYIFKGNIRVNRDWLMERNSTIIEKIETMIFKGKDHIKRGIGFTSIPKKKMVLFEEYKQQFQSLIYNIIDNISFDIIDNNNF